VVAAAALAVSACGGDDEAESNTTTTAAPATTTAPEALTVLVTNDDGYAAPGIDALVEGLTAVEGLEVIAVAPATDRTGTGGSTTPGALVTEAVETASGHPATAVVGFPADTIRAAVEDLGLEPDLVISGVNLGQNLGPITEVSGTVGAALAAAAKGIPALAVSQGLGEGGPPDYPSGVTHALDWLAGHRDELAAGPDDGAGVRAVNLNVPTCAEGEVRGVVEVRLAEQSEAAGAVEPADCASTLTGADDDVEAFHNGYVTLTELGG